jgi:iron complex outermembrane recepter protein
MSRGFLLYPALCFSLPILPQAPADQPGYASTVLQGTVIDISGAAILNASVALEDGHAKAIARATTDHSGHYTLIAPIEGIYRETITAAGFKTGVFNNLQLSGGIRNLPDAMLQMGSATETIEVNEPLEVAGGQIATVGHVGILGDLEVQDTPFHVRSYTNTFIENQQAVDLPDILNSDATVVSPSPSSKANQETDVFLIRGFRILPNNSLAIDGLFGLYDEEPYLYFIDRVDVFNGPSAFVMGSPASVGGVINLAPKRAADKPFLLLEPNYLGESIYGGHVDASDRFGSHGAFGARINGAYRDGAGEVRDSRLLNGGVSAGFDFRSKIVLLSLDTQYLRNYNKANPYVLLLGPGLTGLPPAMPTNLSTEPVWMDGSLYEKIILGRANIQLSPKWTLTSGSGFSHENSANPAYCPVVILDYTGTTLCEQIDQATRNYHYSNDVGIRGRFNTGSFSHSLMAGWNRIQQTSNFGPFDDFGPSQPYNLYLPFRPTAPNFILPELSTDFLVDDQSTKGWYLGDTLGVFRDRLLLTGGFRLVTQTIKDSLRDNSIPPDSYRESAVTPSVAGLFKLTSHVSLYGNFIQALEPGWIAPIGTKNAGQILPPYFSNQVEFGAKTDLGGWLGTFALYRISEANGVESAVTNPPTFIQDGRQINKGLEISFAGDLVHGLHAILSASFIDPKQQFTQDPATEGKSASTIPGATERVSLSWDASKIKGLNLNCNLMETGSAAFDIVNSFRVPSWTRLDLGARYTFGSERPLTIRAQVENVANSQYWVSTFSGGLAASGARVVNVSISKAF